MTSIAQTVAADVATAKPPPVSSHILNLATSIDEAVAQLRQRQTRQAQHNDGDNAPQHDNLLVIGDGEDSIPWQLFCDDLLKPVDKVVWAVIRYQADIGDAVAFPSYGIIGRLANIGSKATIARAIIILRLTRWLSLCARVRDAQGRFQGNVYVLHNEPISVADTIYLDPAYLSLLRAMITHHHAQVRQVVKSIIATLEGGVSDEVDVRESATVLQQHGKCSVADFELDSGASADTDLEIADVSSQSGSTPLPLPADEPGKTASYDEVQPDVSAVQDDSTDSAIVVGNTQEIGEHGVQNSNADIPVQNLNAVSSVQNMNSDVQDQELNPVDNTPDQKLNSVPETQVQDLNPTQGNHQKQADSGQVQKLNGVQGSQQKHTASDRVQNLNQAVHCSSCIYKKTTTTNPILTIGGEFKGDHPDTVPHALHFPSQLSASERVLAMTYLEQIPDSERQQVLDELQGRIQQATNTGKPIRNPVGYLVQLCHAVQEHRFQFTSIGLQIQQARQQATANERNAAKPKPIQPPRPKPPPLPASATANHLVKRVLEIQRYAQARACAA